jgi:hypothetical protein
MSDTEKRLAEIDAEYAIHPSQALLNERLVVLVDMMKERQGGREERMVTRGW